MNPQPDLRVATRNRHKTAEIREALAGRFAVRGLEDLPDFPEVEETGNTFRENAELKAVAISRVVRGLVLADDSGLEVDALDGAPGVYSARYAGPGASDAANNAKLLEALAGVSASRRTARFRCALVLAREGAVLAEFEGTVEGRLLEGPRGENGFGYDPLFCPEESDRSFAELGRSWKAQLSHRARALEQLAAWADSHRQ